MSSNDFHLFTSESVSEGHPDKVADRISDAIVDAYIAQDPNAKVACETLVTRNLIVIAGETHSSACVDVESVARDAIRDIGYTDESSDFSHRSPIQIRLHAQAAEIRQGVDRTDGEIGAGDQGLMFGYACDETPELMPLPIMLAHKLMRRQAELRKSGALPWLRPDGKSQVTVRYEGNKPVAVEKVVLSTQHSAEISRSALCEAVVEEIIKSVVPPELRSSRYRIPGESNRKLHGRRPGDRHRPDGAQDHRRYVWRKLPAWRRGVFGKGSDQS